MKIMQSGFPEAIRAAFLFDLIQDVSVLRPIIRTLCAETDIACSFLVSRQFEGRDKSGSWRAELNALAAATGSDMARFESPFAAVRHLQGRRGILFSASESNLPAHAINHQVFLAAPQGYTRITVQHGHECVGFNQNHEQTLAHGSAVRFAADILCGWVPAERLRHLCASERSKYFELGPPMVLNRLYDRHLPVAETGIGLVCENLHSVRMRTTADFQTTYLETLLSFAATEALSGRRVAVRPHPGGQFVIKNKVELPENVELANKPMFKTDLQRFAYGISAPSSVLIDMVLAGIPTAVWTDAHGLLDTSGYDGLATVNTVEDWSTFAAQATIDPEPFLARQRKFLRRHQLDVPATAMRRRLLSLVNGILGSRSTIGNPARTSPTPRARRVLLVANGVIPTLHISFLKPLADLVRQGAVELSVITEKDILQACGKGKMRDEMLGRDYARAQVEKASPDIAVFCRYSGPEAATMLASLRQAGTPVVFHIDDDLLNVPVELGEKKFAEHNRIERTSTIRLLLEQADLVYCSTRRLRERFGELGVDRELHAGAIYCSREIVAPAELREVRTIGFMGNDKTPELTALIPVIAHVLGKYPGVRFELFGSMAMPPELEIFADRITAMPPVSDYDQFVEAFQQLRWDIGLCPLHRTPFNVVKADTKWVDYTSIGAAVVASRDTAYDDCCADGCGILVDDLADWQRALETLIENPASRYEHVVAAQAKVRDKYALERLTEQVLSLFDAAASEVA